MVLAKSVANTRQTYAGKAGGDIDFAVFYLFASAVESLGKKGDVRNRVASGFSGVASHYAEPRPNPPALRRRR
jgi:hypothetical protein